ncbi:hypothetical protein F2P56_009025 [Juglans regia]|uniref:Uncharacterized protein n=1 Tax=Juglans regia TaxID=51240 RepID=A0A833XWE0_JUGRE|nr:hypothetical protein F2P56_009025 [Juglans regia]
MDEFNTCLDNCGLLDLPVSGGRMSWCNGQSSSSCNWARLNRAVFNSCFSSACLEPGFNICLEKHRIIVCWFFRFHREFVQYGPSPFRFQNMWTEHESFGSSVEAVWSEPVQEVGLRKLVAKLKNLKVVLLSWNKNNFGCVGVLIKELEGRVEGLEKQLHEGYSASIKTEYISEKLELETWEHREDLCIAQVAKKAWLDDCDQNSEFFHAVVNHKRKNNFISFMSLPDGIVLYSPEQVHHGVVIYFQVPGIPFGWRREWISPLFLAWCYQMLITFLCVRHRRK